MSGPAGSFSGPLFDPTAIMFVFNSDLTYVGSPARPRLNQNVRREPLVLRATAGECIKVTLRNDIAPKYTDTAGLHGRQHDRRGLQPERRRSPRLEVSLHPQLVFYDVQRSDGSNVGLNPSFGKQTAAPGEQRTYYWYAGDVRARRSSPIEFGATGLTSADPIKHSNKGPWAL